MSIASQPHKFMYDDYCKLPDEPRVELIQGDFLVSPAPNMAHQGVSGKLFYVLFGFVQTHSLGDVFAAPTDVVLSNSNVVQPDILHVSRARKEIITRLNIQGAPDLVIEIVSPGNDSRDTLLKKALYEQFGVREYWIADPDEKSIRLMFLESGKYNLKGTYGLTDTLKSVLLPGLKVPLGEIFIP